MLLLFSYHFPLTDFRDTLWVGLGLGLGLCFWEVMLFQDQHKMLIHECLGKITVYGLP